MITNIGKIDKNTRLVVGVIIAGIGIYLQSWWGLIAIVPIATALVNSCPTYLPFKFSTCVVEKQNKQEV